MPTGCTLNGQFRLWSIAKPLSRLEELDGYPVDVIGINCGRRLDENHQNLVELREATTKPIWFKPNAGLPRIDSQGNTTYDTSPEAMGEQVQAWLEAGAQIIGGCCGSSPDHLKQISKHIHS